MEHSPTIVELSKALCKAQSQMEAVKKTTENPFFKSKYADLAAVLDAVREPLANNGLSIIQAPEIVDGKVAVTTMLAHESGEWIKASLHITPKDLSNPQTYGSIITYFRRYAVQGFVGMASEDDDGEEGRKASEKTEEKKEEKRTETKGGPATKGQKDYMETLFKKSGYKTESDKAAYWKSVTGKDITAAEQLSSNEAHMVIESLKALTNPA